MSDAGSLAALVGTGAAINASYQISTKHDPVPGLVASGVWYALLLGLSAAIGRYDLAKNVAAVTLLAVILYRFIPILNILNRIIVGVQTRPK
jgi:hypothetical protein